MIIAIMDYNGREICFSASTVEISDKVKNIETTAFNVCNKIEISFI